MGHIFRFDLQGGYTSVVRAISHIFLEVLYLPDSYPHKLVYARTGGLEPPSIAAILLLCGKVLRVFCWGQSSKGRLLFS